MSDIAQEHVVPALGTVVAIILFCSAIPAVLKARKNGDLGPINPLPFVAIYANCLSWQLYGIVVDSNPYIFFCNYVGMLIAVWLMLVSYSLIKSVKGKYVYEFLILFSTAVILASGFVISLIKDEDAQQLFSGILSNVALIFFYASPLSTMYYVIKQRNAESLLLPLTILSLVNAVLWVVYGIYLLDYIILVPNGIGVFLAVAQLTLIIIFRKGKKSKTEKIDDDEITDVPTKDISVSNSEFPMENLKTEASSTVPRDGDDVLNINTSSIMEFDTPITHV